MPTSIGSPLPQLSAASRCLRVFHPELPPSENHIRAHRRGGGECYTKDAEGYRNEFLRHIGGAYKIALQRFVGGHTAYSIYRLLVIYTFERDQLLTKGWRDGKGKVASPYKHFDTANRLKLLADCLVQVLGGGIDDCLFFEVDQVKLLTDPERAAGVTLILEEALPSEFGIVFEGCT